MYLPEDDEMSDIMRLTLIENGIAVRSSPGEVVIRSAGTEFEVSDNSVAPLHGVLK